jgi:hypothetical protein
MKQVQVMRIILVEWSPYINHCAVAHNTLTPRLGCTKPGIYAEYMASLLILANISYTLHPFIIGQDNVTWGSYVPENDMFDGLFGKVQAAEFDMLLSPFTIPQAERERLLLWFIPAGGASLSIIYRKIVFHDFLHDASRPLRVFDIHMWLTQFGVFMVGVFALTISRILRMKTLQLDDREIRGAPVHTFSDRLFRYYYCFYCFIVLDTIQSLSLRLVGMI